MIGAAGVNQFSAIQSVAAFSAPFTFSVTAANVAAGADPFSYGSALGIYLVNSSLNSAFSVEGNFNPDAGSDYGSPCRPRSGKFGARHTAAPAAGSHA